jgi:hypothetical protein
MNKVEEHNMASFHLFYLINSCCSCELYSSVAVLRVVWRPGMGGGGLRRDGSLCIIDSTSRMKNLLVA